MKKKRVSIGADHAGFELKQQIIAYLRSAGHEVQDKGTNSNERADYPDFGHTVAESVLKNETDLGVLMCGSGNGIAMTANKHKGIRAALCWNPEIAQLARQHNNANILVLPARYMSPEEAMACVDTFFKAEFEGGRHQVRVEKIDL
jgi:ribose 5-phosphate isomerase B